MSRRFAILSVLLAALSGATAAHAQSADASGTWLTQAGDARVKIRKPLLTSSVDSPILTPAPPTFFGDLNLMKEQ